MVPAVPEVFPEPEQELVERLGLGVEVVGEGLLQHVVHGVQVALVGEAVAGTTDQPEPHAGSVPQRGRGHQAGFVGGDGPG